jgi:hypothetical protein
LEHGVKKENCVHHKDGFCSLLQIFEELVLGKQSLSKEMNIKLEHLMGAQEYSGYL